MNRNDGQGMVMDDIEDIATGAPEVASNMVRQVESQMQTIGRHLDEVGGNVQEAASNAASSVQQAGATILGVDATTDTTFNGSEHTAGGTAGYFERAAQADLKENGDSLMYRFMGSDKPSNTLDTSKYDKQQQSGGSSFGFGG